ncbi:MAG: PKD domain-containing protein [Flavobacteriales bacterium]|nr:PKD domain-containing protein [Flavobacteriales bacterium]
MKRILSLVIFCLAINLSDITAQCIANYGTSSNNLTVQFLDSSITAPAILPTYFWDFGDGNVSTLQNPSHTNSSAGTYFTCLTIEDASRSCLDSICYSISISNGQTTPCMASFTYVVNPNNVPGSVNSVNFRGAVTSGVAPFTYAWDFGIPGSPSPNSFITFNPYNSAGTYGVTFTVTDANGFSCSYFDSVYVNTCNANFSSQMGGNGFVRFSNLSVPTGAYINSNWDFGDGNFSTLENPSHTYSSSGIYLACLTVQSTSGSCSDSACYNITVSTQAQACIALFTSQITPNGSTSTVFFTNQSTGFTNNTFFTFDFGDGTSTTFSATSSNLNRQRSYAPGTYVVTLSMVDTINATNCSFTDTVIVVNNIPPPCIASFSYLINPNYTVNFFGSATGGSAPYTYSWNFGIGNGSTVMNPNFSYSTPGSYVTSLTVTDVNGFTCSFSDTIHINNTCLAAFSYAFTGNGVVNFTNLSSPSGARINFSWNFGDGTSSNSVNPTHSYTNLGDFPVQLSMFDSSNNCSSQFMDTISITSTSNCQAAFSYTTNNDTLFTQNLASNYTSLSYNFGDSTTSTVGVGNPSHVYTLSGTYIVCQTVVDTMKNCSDTFCDTIVINIVPPCQAGFTFSVNDNVVSILNGASNYTSLFYEFGDGSVLGTPNPMYTYAQSGTYTICQTILNTNTGCRDTFCDSVIIVVPPPCQAGFSYSINNDSVGFQNSALQYDSISYSFGDGFFSNSPNPIHVYNQSGTYIVCQTIINVTGCFDTICDTINIPPPCQAGFTFTDSLNIVDFQNTAQNYTTISYDFGDGSSSSQSDPTHTYANSGSYVVCQTVSLNNNCTSTYCDTVLIRIPPPCQAGFTYAVLGDTIHFTSSASSFNRVVYYFGDGNSSSAINPIYDYQTSGSYEVTQVVYNDTINCADSITQTITLTVSFSCVAKYEIAIDTNRRGTLFLINTSSDDGTHNYFWDFGDGSNSNIRLPKHQFSENIAYKICLTVSDSIQACTSTYCDSVGLDSNGGILKTNGFKLNIIDGSFIGLEEESIFNDISIFPNPFSDRLTIELKENQQINYQIIQINGKVIQEGTFNNKKYSLHLKQIQTGIYLLRLFNEDSSLIKKIIKQ